jgi:hypothetical protein
VTGDAIDAILRDEEHSEDDIEGEEERQIQMKHKAINRLSCKSTCVHFDPHFHKLVLQWYLTY